MQKEYIVCTWVCVRVSTYNVCVLYTGSVYVSQYTHAFMHTIICIYDIQYVFMWW